MKKIKLLETSAAELMTAAEMKQIYGGSGSVLAIYKCSCSGPRLANLTDVIIKATSSGAAAGGAQSGSCKDYPSEGISCVYYCSITGGR
jgi:hypothetical protein